MINAVGQASANGGTILFFGMLAGGTTPFPLTTFGRRIAVYGYTFLKLENSAGWEEMKRYIFEGLSSGTFLPKIAKVFPFAETVEAYRYLESNQQVGKVVVRL